MPPTGPNKKSENTTAMELPAPSTLSASRLGQPCFENLVQLAFCCLFLPSTQRLPNTRCLAFGRTPLSRLVSPGLGWLWSVCLVLGPTVQHLVSPSAFHLSTRRVHTKLQSDGGSDRSQVCDTTCRTATLSGLRTVEYCRRQTCVRNAGCVLTLYGFACCLPNIAKH